MTGLVFATNNLNKLKEISPLLKNKVFHLLSLSDIECKEELPETKETLEGNALQKARYVYEKYGKDCFADDTGLEVHALGGRPGVYSARYAGPGKNAEDNMEKLLNELKNKPDRKAHFRTVIVLVMEGNHFLFEGVINGRIGEEKRGSSGFGYDPVFIPEGYEKTFAEMTLAEKNKISHRAKAIEKLVEFLNTKN